MTPPVIDPNANDPSAAVIQKVVDVLDDMGISYVFTGAIALAYWVAPRGTKDIDTRRDATSEHVSTMGRL